MSRLSGNIERFSVRDDCEKDNLIFDLRISFPRMQLASSSITVSDIVGWLTNNSEFPLWENSLQSQMTSSESKENPNYGSW